MLSGPTCLSAAATKWHLLSAGAAGPNARTDEQNSEKREKEQVANGASGEAISG